MNDSPEPADGSVWRHRNGSLYVVLFLTNQTDRPATYPRTVVYQGADGRRWSRPLSDWSRSMTAGDADDHDTFELDRIQAERERVTALRKRAPLSLDDEAVRPPGRDFTGADLIAELDEQ